MNTATPTQEQTGYEPDIGQEKNPVEVAFIQSQNLEFDGVKLQAYSPMRVVAAQAMGLHHGRVDSAGMEQFERVAVYPGAVRDVCVVLWLCSIQDDREIDMAARAPVHAAKLAIEWGTSHGIINPSSDKFSDAFALFFKIMKHLKESYGTPQKKIPEEAQHQETAA